MKELLIVAGIHLLAVMSPGPDFAMVLKNSLVHSRRTGILAAVGLALGIATHVTYSLLGIALIISRSILLFDTIRLLGAAYLIYIGLKGLMSKSHPKESEELATLEYEPKDLPTWQAIRMGYLTNILNPKATLFFLALFTQVISPSTSLGLKLAMGIEMSLATFTWFALVAIMLTQKPVRRAFKKVAHHLDKAFGAVLVALGLKIAFSGHR